MMASFEYNSSISKVVKGYSNTPLCPWGEIHQGFDFYFNNNQRIFAAAPGLVKSISLINRSTAFNKYAMNITIQFSSVISTEYIFEINSSDINDYNAQLSKIFITEGEWIMLEWGIGDFYQVSSESHVHFAVKENETSAPICKYYSSNAYDKMMDLVKYHGLNWTKLCYLMFPLP